jgi:hypothetical protein
VIGDRYVSPSIQSSDITGNKLIKIIQNGPFGENLAANQPNATAAVDSWTLFKTSINLNNLTSILETRPPSPRHILQLTQLVWKQSTQIGCGRTNCGGQNGVQGWLMVCEFFPRGNIAGEFETNVQGTVSGTGQNAGKGSGVIGAAKGADGKRPNAGDIGKAKSDGGRVLDRMQLWFVFALVWLVMGAVFM